ncbi:YebC/PmpR family DNA-binding transcriptional regulator [Helicobacter sp. MIT 14-3879]|uniref:YebC/PmpR family DNA-binding transcriptional regulator n=1 Tax=Helicobacter sp. MIT 14-3879 TaxID=2040649 RepID=UPI000E1EDFC8|nr:YebC/PmpR family DNA-binding transcriptional regulator [Helicobacter sp. MIT 14-3879]RDU65600.1 YebC/PmpR family DNA-binding transcriptional regulator [Helicobacter sp. MIT 14-3879]
MGRAFEYRRASKEKRWDKMSKLFPKLAKAITIAAKDGGTDPESNAKLRSAILNAKAQNLPKDNIEAAIKRAGGKDSELNEISYEAKAQFGVMMIIDCASDNAVRTIANLKSYCNKYNAQIIPNGSLEFMFNKKAVFEIAISDNLNIEEVELELIDFGLENIEQDDKRVYIYADYKDFGNLSNGIKKLNLEIISSNLKQIPTSPIELSEAQIAELEKLLDKIEDDDDVQNVWTNLA